MAEDEVLASISSSGVATVVLNRPRALNSLNHNMMTRILQLYSDWDTNNGPPTCVVLKGAGGKV